MMIVDLATIIMSGDSEIKAQDLIESDDDEEEDADDEDSSNEEIDNEFYRETLKVMSNLHNFNYPLYMFLKREGIIWDDLKKKLMVSITTKKHDDRVRLVVDPKLLPFSLKSAERVEKYCECIGKYLQPLEQ